MQQLNPLLERPILVTEVLAHITLVVNNNGRGINTTTISGRLGSGSESKGNV